MPVQIYDYRKDIKNLEVHPEIRARFMRMEPAPAGLMHSHDLGGEIFLVLEGLCEFIVENEPVTCGPGQLIYIEPRVKHTLHAVGDQPCVVYLSVTPHVEPTHTYYDDQYNQLPPRFGAWRGKDHGDSNPGVDTGVIADQYLEAAQDLARSVRANQDALESRVQAFKEAAAAMNQSEAKQIADEMWLSLREVLEQVASVELAWNSLSPRAMPEK
jgi:quercetin dioxygenase-like cupin family protein